VRAEMKLIRNRSDSAAAGSSLDTGIAAKPLRFLYSFYL
jgi:hypothetical protein